MRHPDDVLIHFGVKGMKWGVKKDTSSSGDSGGKMTRGQKKYAKTEAKQQAKQAKNDFYQKKAQTMIEKAAADQDNLIALRYSNSAPTAIVTGKQFIEHLSNGGLLDIKSSYVYAEKKSTSEGEQYYERNFNEQYKKPSK